MARRRDAEPKERVNFTLDPATVKHLQNASDASGLSMSALVQVAVEYMLLGGHLEEANSFVLSRRIAMIEKAFEKEIEAAKAHRISEGLPAEEPGVLRMRFESGKDIKSES